MFHLWRCRLLDMLRSRDGVVAFLFLWSVARLFAQSSGSLALGEAGSLSYSFSHNAATNTVTVTIGASYSDPWYIETGLTRNGAVVISSPPFPAAVGASGAGSYTFYGVPGDVLVIMANGRNGANGAGTDGRSGTWTIGSVDRKITVSLRNDRNVPVTYRLEQDGTVLGSITLQPGQAIIQSFTVNSASEVKVFELVSGLARDGDNWVYDPAAVHSEEVASVPPSNVEPGGPNPPATPVTPAPNVPKTVTPTPPSKQVVWRSVAPNNDPTQQKDLLTNAVYREGVEKIVEKLDEKESLADLAPPSAALLNAAVAGQIAAQTTLVNGLIESNVGAVPGAVAPAVNAGSSGWPTFTLPMLGTIVFSPDRVPWLAPIMLALREALLWLMVLAFIRFGVDTCNTYELQALGMPQVETTITAVEVATPAGQAVAWLKQGITAAAIVTVLITAYGVAILLIDTQIGLLGQLAWKSVVSGISPVTNVIQVSGGNAIWGWLLSFFPLRAFLSLLIGEIVFLFAIGKIFLVASAIVKAIRA